MPATARVRELTRGGRRKNDVIDAVIDPAAAASVAALAAGATPIAAEDPTTVLALLDERRPIWPRSGPDWSTSYTRCCAT